MATSYRTWSAMTAWWPMCRLCWISLIPKEVDVQTRTGTWYTMRILPYRTLDNVIEGAVITFVDITESKKAQEALRETQTILNAALDNIQIGIAIADAPSGTLQYVNNAALAILGSDRKQVVEGIGIDQYVAGGISRILMTGP